MVPAPRHSIAPAHPATASQCGDSRPKLQDGDRRREQLLAGRRAPRRRERGAQDEGLRRDETVTLIDLPGFFGPSESLVDCPRLLI